MKLQGFSCILIWTFALLQDVGSNCQRDWTSIRHVHVARGTVSIVSPSPCQTLLAGWQVTASCETLLHGPINNNLIMFDCQAFLKYFYNSVGISIRRSTAIGILIKNHPDNWLFIDMIIQKDIIAKGPLPLPHVSCFVYWCCNHDTERYALWWSSISSKCYTEFLPI